MNATLDHAAGVEAGRNAPTVRVWDPLVRLFHWSLAACILGAFLVEEGDTAHQWLGYTALALVAVRVAWGFVGTRHARFSDWVRGPRAVAGYLRERAAGTSRRRLGHNPAAAVMILLLLAGTVAGPGAGAGRDGCRRLGGWPSRRMVRSRCRDPIRRQRPADRRRRRAGRWRQAGRPRESGQHASKLLLQFSHRLRVKRRSGGGVASAPNRYIADLAQSMHSAASGRTSSRSGAICSPQRAHSP